MSVAVQSPCRNCENSTFWSLHFLHSERYNFGPHFLIRWIFLPVGRRGVGRGGGGAHTHIALPVYGSERQKIIKIILSSDHRL